MMQKFCVVGTSIYVADDDYRPIGPPMITCSSSMIVSDLCYKLNGAWEWVNMSELSERYADWHKEIIERAAEALKKEEG